MQYFNVTDAAKRMGVSRRHLYELIRTKKIPASNAALNIGGLARWVLSEKDIDSFLLGRRTDTTPTIKRGPKEKAIDCDELRKQLFS